MADNTKKLTYVIEINDKGKVKIEDLTRSFVKAETAFKKLGDEIKSTTEDGLNPLIDKTGLAGATLVEFGRTISDMPYGIRGIANNLSQLSTLMVTLISTTGGLNNAWVALKKAFTGPLGVIVIFQGVIALLDYLAGKTSKAAEEIDNIRTASATAGSNLKILRDVMDDSNLSIDELQRTVKKANEQYKDLNLQVDENGRLTKESREQIDLKIHSLERLAKAMAIQKEIEKVFTELTKNQVQEEKALQAEEDKRAFYDQKRIDDRNKALQTGVSIAIEATETIIQRNKESVRESFKEQREELLKELNILTEMIKKENLLDELFPEPKAKDELGKRAKAVLIKFDSELKNFFLDIDKDGVDAILVKGIERVKNIYKPLFESAKEGLIPLKNLGDEYNRVLKLNEESLKNGLRLIKDQARDVTNLFKQTQQALGYVNSVIMSYHQARMTALATEREYILHSSNLSATQQKEAIADIEQRELKAQERKIKAERDLFTIKQSLLIAEEIMKIKADFAERKRIFENAQVRIVGGSVESIAAAQFSLGTFVQQLGPAGIATYAITIGGLIASILAARKKAQAALASLGAPSGPSVGGAGVEAPDFNVVGASPESQLAQSVSAQQQKPLKAFVVYKDIKDANELDRAIGSTATLG